MNDAEVRIVNDTIDLAKVLLESYIYYAEIESIFFCQFINLAWFSKEIWTLLE